MPDIIEVILIEDSTSGKKRYISFDLKRFCIIRNEQDRKFHKVFLEIVEDGITFSVPVPGGHF